MIKVEGPLHVVCQCDKCKPQIAFNAEVVGYVAPQRIEQEPCAKHCEATAFEIVIKNLQGEIGRMKTAQRTWVGLTESNRKEIQRQSVYVDGAIRMTEAKLKVKNT